MDRKAIVRAIAADMAENPSVVYALSNMKTRKDFVDFILSDIHREVGGFGPVAFPHLRGIVRMAAAQKAQDVGMGFTPISLPGLSTTVQQTVQKEVATKSVAEAQKSTMDWGGFLGSLVGTIGQVGASIYTSKQMIDLEKKKLDMIESQEAAARQAQAAMLEAQMRSQQASIAQGQTGAPSGIPSWLLPVGIGAAALLGVFMFMKKR